jgi:hypothetical protein
MTKAASPVTGEASFHAKAAAFPVAWPQPLTLTLPPDPEMGGGQRGSAGWRQLKSMSSTSKTSIPEGVPGRVGLSP